MKKANAKATTRRDVSKRVLPNVIRIFSNMIT